MPLNAGHFTDRFHQQQHNIHRSNHEGLMIEQKNFFFLPSSMYPLQLEKYIPFRFSRFLTVKKKNEWRGFVFPFM